MYQPLRISSYRTDYGLSIDNISSDQVISAVLLAAELSKSWQTQPSATAVPPPTTLHYPPQSGQCRCPPTEAPVDPALLSDSPSPAPASSYQAEPRAMRCPIDGCDVMLPEGKQEYVSTHFRNFHAAWWLQPGAGKADVVKCPVCGVQCLRNKLTGHFAIEHIRSPDYLPYECTNPSCGERFLRRTELGSHARSH